MRFAELTQAYDRIEATPKRLEIRKLLSELLSRLEHEELGEVLFLSQGLLRPEYEGVELGVADSLAAKAVLIVTGAESLALEEKLRASGDLGTTVEFLLGARTQGVSGSPLTVNEVYEALRSIGRASGEGSQEEKVRRMVALLERSEPQEAKYIVRFLLGRMRLGVREMTLLDALADRFAPGDKGARARIEAAFNVSSDLALVAETLAREGLEGLGRIRLKVGRPIRPMLAERSPTLSDLLERMGGRAALEYKYDGLRVQAHIPETGAVKLFSRRLEELSAQFPELVEELSGALRERPAILEGECVSVNPETEEILPFQSISRRRGRKYDLERMRSEIPVRLFVFDVLLVGEASQIDRPFPERRAELEKLVKGSERVRLAEQATVASVEEASAFFERSIADGCEGIVAKSLAAGSGYRAGARGFWWIKYKRDYTAGLEDSVDGVVVGAFFGRGRRAGGYGALLMAVYNPERDQYETFCKVGSGFDDELVQSLPERLKSFEVAERPHSVVTEVTPDRWFRPEVVLEVKGAELSLSPNHRAAVGVLRADAGLALRFPRFTGRFRTDKAATDATTSSELVTMYRSQVKQPTPPEAEEPGQG
ncbi:MAG: ATP-dependent DNA ligase [Thermoplasmata archaeon]|nr:ATP-dependent DNA ligase [Thermoplasmata archaeon]